MLKLYIRDNTSGNVHEYGTNQHDALVLQKDGSLHYENLQCFCGTEFAEEGYSFCLADGRIPNEIDDENYIDIGGEYYNEGEWIDVPYPNNPSWKPNKKCSICGRVVRRKTENYCPRCGAKMKGVKR